MTPRELRRKLIQQSNCPHWVLDEVLDEVDLEDLARGYSDDEDETFDDMKRRLAYYLDDYAKAVTRLRKALLELEAER